MLDGIGLYLQTKKTRLIRHKHCNPQEKNVVNGNSGNNDPRTAMNGLKLLGGNDEVVFNDSPLVLVPPKTVGSYDTIKNIVMVINN